ncbi:MAG: DUF2064 domain-containing protein [Tenacibaculum sp.]
MSHNQKQTAILIFAFSAKKEASQKVFNKSEALFKTLNEKTIAKAKKTGVDVIVSTEVQQIGCTFGERFSNAIQAVFNKGYQQVITIGNDSPNLKTQQLLTALNNLQKGIVTLGPTLDGGTYLIAFNKHQFYPSVFKNISWKTSKVITELKEYFKTQKAKTKQLVYLTDVDTQKDLFFLAKKSTKRLSFLSNFIIDIAITTTVVYHNLYTSKKHIHCYYNKGSPSLI